MTAREAVSALRAETRRDRSWVGPPSLDRFWGFGIFNKNSRLGPSFFRGFSSKTPSLDRFWEFQSMCTALVFFWGVPRAHPQKWGKNRSFWVISLFSAAHRGFLGISLPSGFFITPEPTPTFCPMGQKVGVGKGVNF